MSIFITGTDTDVGKTRVAALLVRALPAWSLPVEIPIFAPKPNLPPSLTCSQFKP